jgi:hypothetical protein
MKKQNKQHSRNMCLNSKPTTACVQPALLAKLLAGVPKGAWLAGAWLLHAENQTKYVLRFRGCEDSAHAGNQTYALGLCRSICEETTEILIYWGCADSVWAHRSAKWSVHRNWLVEFSNSAHRCSTSIKYQFSSAHRCSTYSSAHPSTINSVQHIHQHRCSL